MAKYILSLDQGTTSSRAILFDQQQNILAVSQKEFTQIYPKEGWVEHNPMEIWSSQYAVMMEVVAQSGIHVSDLAAIGITNQRETTIVWDKTTGTPIYNAIVWQCRRTAPLVDQLIQQGLTDHIKAATGLLPDALTSPPPRSAGSWTMWKGHSSGQNGASFCLARWIPGCCGS